MNMIPERNIVIIEQDKRIIMMYDISSWLVEMMSLWGFSIPN